MELQAETPTPEGDVSIQSESADIEQVLPTDEVVEEIAETEEQVSDTSDDVNEDQTEITVDDLSEFLGIESDKFVVTDDGVQFKAKIDGKETSVPFNDAIVAYQKRGHLDNQNREVAALKKEVQTQRTQLQSQYSEKLQMAEDLTALAYQDIQSDYQSINWEELRAEDPGEYAAKQQEYNQRVDGLAQRLGKIQAERTQQKPDLTEARKEMAQALIEQIDEWSDSSVADKEYLDIGNYALTQGFDAESFNSTTDPRMIMMLRKAMLFDGLQQKKPAITNVVRRAAKLAKPGAKTQPKAAPQSFEDVFYGKN